MGCRPGFIREVPFIYNTVISRRCLFIPLNADFCDIFDFIQQKYVKE
jgi:hypothetical protein